jgi:small redox-active disulfide protein 2
MLQKVETLSTIPIDTLSTVSNNGNIRRSTMIIQILGTGCPKCKTLEANARKAIEDGSIDATIEKVTEIDQIMDMGVMMTPALAIDGEVVSAGKILSKDQILAYVQGAV